MAFKCVYDIKCFCSYYFSICIMITGFIILMLGYVHNNREISSLVSTTCLVENHDCKLFSAGWKPVCVGSLMVDVEYTEIKESVNVIRIQDCRKYTETCIQINERLNNTWPIGLSIQCYYSPLPNPHSKVYLSIPDRSDKLNKSFIVGIVLLGIGIVPVGIYLILNCANCIE